MIKIVFVSEIDNVFARTAVAFARKKAPSDIHVLGAGLNTEAAGLSSQAENLMFKRGFDISGQVVLDYKDISLYSVDVLVNISKKTPQYVQYYLPGDPIQVDWKLDDFSEESDFKVSEINRFLDLIEKKVDEFFNSEYYRILLHSGNRLDLVLNHLKDGIIVHDMKRRISYFNRRAEKITGYQRSEVIGRDCHEVFKNKFCGEKCSFCEPGSKVMDINYPLDVIRKDKSIVRVDFSGKIILEGQKPLGVLASFNYQDEKELLQARKKQNHKTKHFHGIISRNKMMVEIFDLVRSVAETDVPVLIQGESGTGKELIANALHREGDRKEQIFLPINCGALPENLLESELFGYVKGAFTGAVKDKKGRFELADGGTIFLDEIGDISPAMQVKLLRVLQDGTFERLGDTRTIKTNVRIISATNKDLRQEIVSGNFREDLYYRLCVMPIYLPPLQQRKEDIRALTTHFIRENRIGKNTETEISDSALQVLKSYTWPGNIRELQNVVQFALIKCKGNQVEAADLPEHLSKSELFQVPADKYGIDSAGPNSQGNYNGLRILLTREKVLEVLMQTDGNKAKTARLLGVSRATLYRFIKRYPDLSEKYQ